MPTLPTGTFAAPVVRRFKTGLHRSDLIAQNRLPERGIYATRGEPSHGEGRLSLSLPVTGQVDQVFGHVNPADRILQRLLFHVG